MISKTIDMAQASENFQTIMLVINNSVLNKPKYYNILKELNSQVFNCNVKVKLVNNEGLFDYIEHAFLNRDIYNKLLNFWICNTRCYSRCCFHYIFFKSK